MAVIKSASFPEAYRKRVELAERLFDGKWSDLAQACVNAICDAFDENQRAPTSLDLQVEFKRAVLKKKKHEHAALARELQDLEDELEDLLYEREQRNATQAHSQKFETPEQLVRHARREGWGRKKITDLARDHGWRKREVHAAETALTKNQLRTPSTARRDFKSVTEFIRFFSDRVPNETDAWRSLAESYDLNADEVLAALARDPQQTWLPIHQRERDAT